MKQLAGQRQGRSVPRTENQRQSSHMLESSQTIYPVENVNVQNKHDSRSNKHVGWQRYRSSAVLWNVMSQYWMANNRIHNADNNQNNLTSYAGAIISLKGWSAITVMRHNSSRVHPVGRGKAPQKHPLGRVFPVTRVDFHVGNRQ